MNQIIEMNVSTPEQFIRAVRLSQNVFENQTVINVINRGESFARASELTSDIQYGVTSLYKNTAGSFAGAQLSQFSIKTISDPFGRSSKLLINARYFSTSKELNDLICVSAEIAGLLNKKVRNRNDDLEKIYMFDRWVKKNFEYRNTSQIRDHIAIELLKKRRGVCQSLAALAVLVLSYMGVKVLYVSGEGKGNDGWSPHAWNSAYINGQWIHMDFTFSMNFLRLSCTKSRIEEKFFVKTHRWDKKEYSSRSMDSKWKSICWNKEKGVNIIVNAESCRINGVEVKFSSKLLVKDGNRILVDLASIIRLMGGGIELIPNTGTINVCVCNKRIILKGALKHFHDVFFDQIVLNHIWKNECINDSELRIAI